VKLLQLTLLQRSRATGGAGNRRTADTGRDIVAARRAGRPLGEALKLGRWFRFILNGDHLWRLGSLPRGVARRLRGGLGFEQGAAARHCEDQKRTEPTGASLHVFGPV
jgi:hypothetical protein